MKLTLEPGTPVEIYMPWASNGPFRKPSYDWFKGYEFVRYDDDRHIIIKHTNGTFAECDVSYPCDNVRVDIGNVSIMQDDQ